MELADILILSVKYHTQKEDRAFLSLYMIEKLKTLASGSVGGSEEEDWQTHGCMGQEEQLPALWCSRTAVA